MTKYKQHEVVWDKKNQIVRAIGNGVADESCANFMLEQTALLAAEHGPLIDWLVNLDGVSKTTSKGRRILAQSTGDPSIRKYALVGGSTIIRTISTFILAASGQKNARHFSTEAEAVEWLKQDR